MAGSTSDASGQTNPYERAKVHIAYGYGLTGTGVKVGVVDSGFNLVDGRPAHQDFDGSGKVVLLASSEALKSDAHGTHVSGLLAGERDGLTMHGVAYGATLYLGMSPTTATGFKSLFDEFRSVGVLVSSNSYGIPMEATDQSPWKPVKTDGYEVTARNAIAYRDAQGITSSQMMANIFGGPATDWQAAVASMAAYQAAGGVIIWANSNYGLNDIANGRPGLDDADLGAALPLAFNELRGAWITVVNGSSRGLAIQSSGQDYVDKATALENNIFLNSAPCGLAAAFCLTMDGLDVWSGSNTGAASYESQGGTSQATPQVAGMIALLREAFPAASAADLTARLLYTANNSFFVTNTTVSKITTASYTNANGTITHQVSDIWGHGFPDMQAALNPVGSTSTRTLSGRSLSVAELAGQISLGSAFGSGKALGQLNFLFNDQLNGVFAASMSTVAKPDAALGVAGIVGEQAAAQDTVQLETSGGQRLAFGQKVQGGGFGERVRVRRTFAFASPVGENGEAMLGYGFSVGRSLGFGADGGQGSASLSERMMSVPVLDFGKERQAWAAGSMRSSGIRATVGLFGTTDMGLAEIGPRVRFNQSDSSGSVVDFVFGGASGLQINLTAGQVEEAQAFLGSTFRSDTAALNSTTQFTRFGLKAPLSDRLSITGSWMVAETRVEDGGSGLVGGFRGLQSDAAAVNLEFRDVVGPATRLSVGLARPMGITRGHATVNLPGQILINAPGDYSYQFADRRVSLVSDARQLDMVVDLERRVSERLSFGVGGMIMDNPGHDGEASTGFAATARMKFVF